MHSREKAEHCTGTALVIIKKSIFKHICKQSYCKYYVVIKLNGSIK